MVRAVRVSSIEKGLDPREFALVAFGGGGALCTADVATELGIGTVVVPEEAGLLSAKGLLVTDHKNDYSITRISLLDETDKDELVKQVEEMKGQAIEDFRNDGVNVDKTHFLYSLDLRYSGQAYEITIPIPGEIQNLSFKEIKKLFFPSLPITLTTLLSCSSGLFSFSKIFLILLRSRFIRRLYCF